MAGVTEFNNNSTDTLNSMIRKRDGRVVSFEQSKISNAIYKALVATGKVFNAPREELLASVEALGTSRETLLAIRELSSANSQPMTVNGERAKFYNVGSSEKYFIFPSNLCRAMPDNRL